MKLRCAVGSILAGLLATSAAATTVQVMAVDLNDNLGPGGDLWEFTYAVSGHTFLADQGFSIHFDQSLFGGILPRSRWGRR